MLALVALQQDATYVLSTYGQSPSQKVSRAFAAELLAPARGIQQLLGFVPDPDFAPAIEYCANHFEVSTMVIEHQIQNQLS